MLTPISTSQPTVLVVDFPTGRGRLAGAADLLTVAPSALQDTGANVSPLLRYDQLGRSIYQITDLHGTFTNALTVGYRWLV